MGERAGSHGAAALRKLLDRRTFRLTDSELERELPGLGLVVETDGLRYHRTPGRQAADRRRDHAHARAGLTAVRFTHAQVRYEAQEVVATLVDLAARLAAEQTRLAD